jgi:hypothetical protein
LSERVGSECRRQFRQVAAGDDAGRRSGFQAVLGDKQRGDGRASFAAVGELVDGFGRGDGGAGEQDALTWFGEGQDAADGFGPGKLVLVRVQGPAELVLDVVERGDEPLAP